MSSDPDPLDPLQRRHPLECCGDYRFKDVDLRSSDIQQIDLSNNPVNKGEVDAFLTAPDCVKLFDPPYNGSGQPLCRVYIGPVKAGMITSRQTIPKGAYRLFAQAWTSNDTSNLFYMEIGLWTNKCNPNLGAPSP